MCFTDVDHADVWKVVDRMARRQHVCSECGLPRPPGAYYTHISWLAEGSWDRTRIHATCYALYDFIVEELCERSAILVVNADGLREEIEEQDEETKEVLTWLWDCARAPYESERRVA